MDNGIQKPVRLSAHKNTDGKEYELRYHRRQYLPQEVLDKCEELYQKYRGKLKLSFHPTNTVRCDDGHVYEVDKVNRIANAYTTIKDKIFEVNTIYASNVEYPYIIKNFVAQFSYDENFNVAVNYFFDRPPKIGSVWVNDKSDDHPTLNLKRYIKDRKDRKEKVRYYKGLINSIRYKGPGAPANNKNTLKQNEMNENRFGMSRERLDRIISESVKKVLNESLNEFALFKPSSTRH